MCEEREGEQTDRKSHCDSKQSSITSACVFHGALSCGSAETIFGIDSHLLGKGDTNPH